MNSRNRLSFLQLELKEPVPEGFPVLLQDNTIMQYSKVPDKPAAAESSM